MKFFVSSLTFNISSRKCSDERKFGIESLQYLYSIMPKNGENRWCGCRGNQCVFHERFLDHSLSETDSHLNISTFIGNFVYVLLLNLYLLLYFPKQTILRKREFCVGSDVYSILCILTFSNQAFLDQGASTGLPPAISSCVPPQIKIL